MTKAKATENTETGAEEVQEVERDVPRAELYFATVRLIDMMTKRGTVEGGELLTVGTIRQRYVDWLVEQGFVNTEQPQQPPQ